jgi:hypothetical protein
MLLAFHLAWDPGIRGVLVVVVAIAVLMGSVYLLLGTNLGSRLGFLIAFAGLFGWLTIMGTAWWIYAIGYKGRDATWRVREVVTSVDRNHLVGAQLAQARTLQGWRELKEGDTKRGEAQASADEALTGTDSRVKVFKATSDYVTLAAYDKGGKAKSSFFNKWHIPAPHPPHYAVVQVQQVIPVQILNEGDVCKAGNICIPFGTTPPKAKADPSAPIISVVMERDLGSKRLPSATLTIACGIVFGVTCNALHRRDKLAIANRAAVPAEA